MTAVLLDDEVPCADDCCAQPVISRVYQQLKDAGWPTIDVDIRPLGWIRNGILVQRHLDGTGWVMNPNGGTICVQAEHLGNPPGGDAIGLRAWRPINTHGLSESHVNVLLAIAGPGTLNRHINGPTSWGAGVIDEEIATVTGLAVGTIGHLRQDLMHKQLVAEKQGIYAKRESTTGVRAQLWVATKAGHDALCPPTPSQDRLTTQLSRAVAATG